MNLAFPALVILLLVLPGIIYRYAYARGPWGWASPTSLRTVSDELAYSLVVAAVLHAAWLCLVGLLGYRADVRSLLALLAGNFGHDSRLLEPALHAIADHLGSVALYFLTLYAAAALLGMAGHALVRKLALDHRTKVFRFENEWYYLLTGEVLAFHDVDADARDIDGVYLSAVVEHGQASYLYRGIVQDFSFNRSGELDRILLRMSHRRLLARDREPGDDAPPIPGVPDARYYDIRGDVFVLRYSEIKTLNLDYFSLKPEDTPETAPGLSTGPRADGTRVAD
jgi:hypothetical protein